MFRIISTYLDNSSGPDLFDDGAVELMLSQEEFDSEEDALQYIQVDLIGIIKEDNADALGYSLDKIKTSYSFDGEQAYIDVSVDFGEPMGTTFSGKYIFRVVEI